MKALYYEKPLRINASICQKPYPICKDHDVVIKIMSCSICHGVECDHEVEGGSGCSKYPLIPGHEFAGYVHEIGKKVTTCKVGDRVTADNVVTCGTCYYCKKGDFIHCPNKKNLGNADDGGFAEFTRVNESKIVKIPDHVSFNEACMSEPVACCMHSMDQMNMKYGDDVLILGAGSNGQYSGTTCSSQQCQQCCRCSIFSEKT